MSDAAGTTLGVVLSAQRPETTSIPNLPNEDISQNETDIQALRVSFSVENVIKLHSPSLNMPCRWRWNYVQKIL